MQTMRHINLFRKITRIETTNCFEYNNTIFFAVPRGLISQAVGPQGSNVRRIGETIRKKIRVIEMFEDSRNLQRFISSIVDPIQFNKFEVIENTAVITAGKQSKAALIGRNRGREQELQDILQKFFGIEKLRIV